LGAASRKMTHCAKVAQCKGQGKDKAAWKTSKGRTLRRKQRAQQQFNKGNNLGNIIKTYRKTMRLEMAKRIARSTVGLQNTKD
jgi:hypothetical protein